MNLFFWQNRKPQARIEVVHSVSMTMDQWRSSPEMVEYAKNLFRTPQFQTLLDVLRNESPRAYGLPPVGSTHDDQIAHAYKGTGYDLCLNNLEALSVPHKQPGAALEMTWAPEPPRPQNPATEERHQQ